MYLHGSRWAEFLTAEAADAGRAVDDCLATFHFNGVRRADARALGAPYAIGCLESGAGGKQRPEQTADPNALGGEQVTAAYRNVLKVPHYQHVRGLHIVGATVSLLSFFPYTHTHPMNRVSDFQMSPGFLPS